MTCRERYRKTTIGNAIADTIAQVRITSPLREGTGTPLHTMSWKMEAVAIQVQFECSDQGRGLIDSWASVPLWSGMLQLSKTHPPTRVCRVALLQRHCWRFVSSHCASLSWTAPQSVCTIVSNVIPYCNPAPNLTAHFGTSDKASVRLVCATAPATRIAVTKTRSANIVR